MPGALPHLTASQPAWLVVHIVPQPHPAPPVRADRQHSAQVPGQPAASLAHPHRSRPDPGSAGSQWTDNNAQPKYPVSRLAHPHRSRPDPGSAGSQSTDDNAQPKYIVSRLAHPHRSRPDPGSAGSQSTDDNAPAQVHRQPPGSSTSFPSRPRHLRFQWTDDNAQPKYPLLCKARVIGDRTFAEPLPTRQLPPPDL